MASHSSIKGTIMVKVVEANGLPNMDYGKQQNPYVLVRLDGGEGDNWSTTDAAFGGGRHPKWTDEDNRDIELYWDGLPRKSIFLNVEVYNDSFGNDDLIGAGKVDVARVVQEKSSTPVDYAVRLSNVYDGAEHRGEVKIRVSFGLPIRKAIRAASRVTRVFHLRDALMAPIVSSVVGVVGPVTKYVYNATEVPRKYIDEHDKLFKVAAGAATAGGLTVAAGGFGICFLMCLPVLFLVMITFPLWILPTIFGTVMTSPIWVPIVFMATISIALIVGCCFSFAITSRPVRRCAAKVGRKIRKSNIGEKLIYVKK